MARFILASLSANTSAIIAILVFFFVAHVATDGGLLSLLFAAFLLSPVLISISDQKKNSIHTYFSNLLTAKSAKYFIVLSITFAFTALLTSLFVSQDATRPYLAALIALVFTVCYLFASPILFRIATGKSGTLPNAKESTLIAAALIAYVLATKALTIISYPSALLVVATSLMGCIFFILTFCVITALYSYRNN